MLHELSEFLAGLDREDKNVGRMVFGSVFCWQEGARE